MDTIVIDARPVCAQGSYGVAGLGQWVKQRRESLGLTQTELAKRTGLSQSTISAIEVGRLRWPSKEIRDDIARALGTSNAQMLVAAGEIDLRDAPIDPTGGDLRLAKIQALWRDISDAQRDSLVVFAEGAAASRRTRERND